MLKWKFVYQISSASSEIQNVTRQMTWVENRSIMQYYRMYNEYEIKAIKQFSTRPMLILHDFIFSCLFWSKPHYSFSILVVKEKCIKVPWNFTYLKIWMNYFIWPWVWLWRSESNSVISKPIDTSICRKVRHVERGHILNVSFMWFMPYHFVTNTNTVSVTVYRRAGLTCTISSIGANCNRRYYEYFNICFSDGRTFFWTV